LYDWDNVITPTLNTPTVITPTLIYFVGPRLKALKTIALHTKKNFRLRDKNHAPFKLNGQSCTAFGLLKAPELQNRKNMNFLKSLKQLTKPKLVWK
jgi:hypothetical protein